MLREKDAEADRTFEMAQRNILNRHQGNRMSAGKSISQINSFIPRNKQELCKHSRRAAYKLSGFYSFEAHFQRTSSI